MNPIKRYILEPLRQRRRWKKIDKLKRQYDLMKWAYGNRIPDDVSEYYVGEMKRIKSEFDKLLLDGKFTR